MKQALLIASFGTTHRDAEELDLNPVIDALRDAHPDAAVRAAFTSRMVIRAIEKQTGRKVDNEREAAARLRKEGFSEDEIRIQPLHLIEGVEYEKLTRIHDEILVGEALFSREADLYAFAEYATKSYTTPTLFIGHGSEHEADAIYRRLHECMAEAGGMHGVATVEGELGRAHALQWLKSSGADSVHLVPLLLVAGDHAKNDIFGDDDSYKTFLEGKGYRVSYRERGLGSDAFVREMFLKKCRALMEDKAGAR